jgi:hypothetical protein
MIIGFKQSDVIQGGKFYNLYQTQVVKKDRYVTDYKGYKAVRVSDELVPLSWLVANRNDIKWRGLRLYIEVPSSFKTVNIPSWLPNRLDENGNIHTLETWGGIVKTSLDGTKIIVKLTTYGDIIDDDFDKLVTFVSGNANINGMTVLEARDLANTIAYKAVEVI